MPLQDILNFYLGYHNVNFLADSIEIILKSKHLLV